METCQLFWEQSCQVQKKISSKDASQKMQFLGTIKKLAILFRGVKTQNSGKSPQNRPSPIQNRSESKFSRIFEQPLNRDKYA